jgi:hypothetical protein
LENELGAELSMRVTLEGFRVPIRLGAVRAKERVVDEEN